MPTYADMPGPIAGKYELQGLIHEGPLIHIFRAHQRSLRRLVALQTLSPRTRGVIAYRHGIIKAAEIIASFVHPNIVPAIDLEESGGVPWIVTQYMEGGPLRTRLTQVSLGIRETVGIVKQIGNALEYVHSQGKVHGDLSTSSIVLDIWGNAYISDFIKRGFDASGSRAILGMPPYIAPERWMGGESTSFSDQYALAAITFEMVAGRPLYYAENTEQIMSMHLHEPIPSLDSIVPNI